MTLFSSLLYIYQMLSQVLKMMTQNFGYASLLIVGLKPTSGINYWKLSRNIITHDAINVKSSSCYCHICYMQSLLFSFTAFLFPPDIKEHNTKLSGCVQHATDN